MKTTETAYDRAIHPHLAVWLVKNGMGAADIARQIGISHSTLQRWRREHPEFEQSLKGGADIADMVDTLVEGSLLKRALGYSYDETTYDWKASPDGGDEPALTPVKTVRKHVQPELSAVMIWLKTRKPKVWGDKKNDIEDRIAYFLEGLRETDED